MHEEPGGEGPCYLAQVDETGSIVDTGSRVQSARSATRRALVIRIAAGGDKQFAALAPGDGESRRQYAARLEEPGPRSAAWRIALLADARPVALEMGAGAERFEPVLLDYLHRLMC